MFTETRCYSPDYNPIEEAFAKIKNLLRKLSLSLSALVLDFLRLLGASVLDLLLTSVLLHRKQEADDDECERNYEQLQPVPDGHPSEACPSRPGYLTGPRFLYQLL
ncbi:MAG: hypothetical protein M3324_03655 [Actinomycetota bacterium]|nr:hypothetical protein [Actinomycetota bacterium]